MAKSGSERLVLKLDGKEIKDLYLSRLTYTEAIGELDGMTALMRIPKGAMGDVAKKLIPGAKFQLDINDEKGKPVKALQKEGDIIAVNFEYVRGVTVVVLVGVNYLHRLRSEHKTKVWEDDCKKIVSAIGKKASLKVKCDAFQFTATTTFQQNETDALFLMRLARENNYICRVVGKTLYFSRRKHTSKTIKITMNMVHEARLTANLKDHLNKVIVYWGDHEKEGSKLKKYVGTPGSSNVVTLNSSGKIGYKLGKQKFKKDKVLTVGGYDMPLYENQSQAKAKADATLEAAAMDFIEGSVKLIKGQPDAFCGATLELDGDPKVAWPFTGKFMITKVMHSYSNFELLTEIGFKSNSLPKEP
jgi:phage protein D